nr:fused MFS/spermidine synthase [Micromonospora sp. DSM 115978]
MTEHPTAAVLELVIDRHRPTGRTLLVNGVPQSYVDVRDPTHLYFDYTRRLGSLIDTAAPPGTPLRVLHLGGGALTLPRYVAATRPGSTQMVIERDPAVRDLVRRELPPLPADVRVTLADARDAVNAQPTHGHDLVLVDVYRAARMPGHVATVEFAAGAARVLRPNGLYAVNVIDLPTLDLSRTQAATLRAVFPDVCAVASRAMLRGRRYGNVVLVAALEPDRLPVRALTARAARDPVPGRVLAGDDLVRFVGDARPLTDAPDPRTGFSGTPAG